ncbi:FAD-binding oxidoreductase [Pseudonocardia sp. GCM10023141]|uniref:FAD-binding oxidoreductase n=2 Tax=Pseudonocardia sp. GCM10023141 TaxID=3252653 RepID=UPI00362225C6
MVSNNAVDAFSETFTGKVYRPGDAGYENSRQVWNADINRYPALVASCSTTADIAAAIAFGRAEELEISVRGGGHNFAGLAVAEGGLMIHLEGVNSVHVDPVTRRAYVGGGCQLKQLDVALAEHGLGVTAGIVSHTGVGGLTLGGGVGFLLRRFGLACDNLVEAEVVLSDGTVVRASATENADLFWALRGGGGNFGIVTEFVFQLHPIGETANVGMFFFPPDRGPDVLRFFRDLPSRLPDDMAILVFGMDAPDAPFVPDEYKHTAGYFIQLVTVGPWAELAAAADLVRSELSPVFEMVEPMRYLDLQGMNDAFNPWGVHGYEKAVYLPGIDDGAIDVMQRHLPGKRGAFSYFAAMTLGGAYARVADEDAAWGGPRDAAYHFIITATCETAEELADDRKWVRQFWTDMRPFGMSSGSYINNMNEYDEDRVRAAYGPEKYDRLSRIKARYDPENVFHHNQNIKPARIVGAGSS